MTNNKQELEELRNSLNGTIACVSGGFDPLHIGHVELIQFASTQADNLVVLVNADPFLMKKKGFVFMKGAERVKIISAMLGVTKAILYEADNQFVTDGLEALHPDVFVNGGDRVENMVGEEVELCNRLGIKLVAGGAKIQSSSNLAQELYQTYLRMRFRNC